jgi:hypothetical protein
VQEQYVAFLDAEITEDWTVFEIRGTSNFNVCQIKEALSSNIFILLQVRQKIM